MALKKFFKKNMANIGHPPGTVSTSSEDKELDFSRLRISKISYNESFFDKEEIVKTTELEKGLSDFKDDQITWINIDSTEPNLIKKIGSLLKIHPLVQEDIVNTHQRPNFQDWDDYIYVVVKMLYYDEEKSESIQEQVSFILGENHLVSFQEIPGDVFNIIRNRIINNKGRIRKLKADYLLYSLLDTIVDQYFVVLDKMSGEIEIIEDKIDLNPNTKNLKRIQKLKQEVILIRRFVAPVKELIISMSKSESDFIRDEIKPFLRDLQDHSHQVIESIEMLRDLITSVLEISHSTISNKMNDIMKVLTIISTIFIPITFVAGIYGMNFENMPELKYAFGYPVVLGAMLLVVIAMLIYFKNKKWL